jgi:serine/threonine-protein kinase
MSESRSLPETIGSYRVVRALGAGGHGRVYLGQHPVIGSKVAIKVLLPEIASHHETVERFIQEARASSQIDSPHLPRYFDFGTTADGLPYAVMEYFEGETLGARLARVGTLSVAETAQIVAQVASALAMAHQAGLVHRDLKPENILLVAAAGKPGVPASISGAGKPAIEVKLLDFGIAKMVGHGSATQTQSGRFLGTPMYCAPEQVFGLEVDPRTDVYSLGATAFEMLTGAPPFVGGSAEILATKATETAPELRRPGVPAQVAHTIRQMLIREPARRAPSMAWVLEQVAGWLTSDSAQRAAIARATTERPAGFARAVDRGVDRRLRSPRSASARAVIALVAAVGAAVAGAAVVVVSARSPSSTRASSSAAQLPAQASPRPGAVSESTAAPATPAAPPPIAPSDPRASAAAPAVPAGAAPDAAGGAAGPATAAEAPGDPAAASAAQIAPGGSPAAPVGTAADPAAPPHPHRAAKLGDDRTGASSAPRGRRITRPPAPARKPAARTPVEPKDVLIVDPFSHGN